MVQLAEVHEGTAGLVHDVCFVQELSLRRDESDHIPSLIHAAITGSRDWLHVWGPPSSCPEQCA